jgi:hypothetical protein
MSNVTLKEDKVKKDIYDFYDIWIIQAEVKTFQTGKSTPIKIKTGTTMSLIIRARRQFRNF